MTQRDRIFAVLESKGYITNRDFEGMGLLHIGRNRISDQEAKDYFKSKGLVVSNCILADEFIDNRWELKKILESNSKGYSQMGPGLGANPKMVSEAVVLVGQTQEYPQSSGSPDLMPMVSPNKGADQAAEVTSARRTRIRPDAAGR